jgi:AraC-like DNA-binding protein
MDVLTDVLRTVRLQNKCYGRFELTAPWGIEVEVSDPRSSHFYVVSCGSGWLEVDGSSQAVPMAGGDLILLPKGGRHVLRDDPGTRAVPITQILAGHHGASGHVFHYGGVGAPASIVAGHFTFEDGVGDALLESLPPLIHVKSEGGTMVQWLQATLQFLTTETALAQPGAETVISRLADILFVQALRAHMASLTDCSRGWLRALKDPPMATALRLMHQHPEQPWTVEALANQVTMSRSAFAERFTRLVGEAPLGYLTRWRMQKAARLMLDGDATLGAIARAVGYETESAFGKAFRRHMGTSPGEYRRAPVLSDRHGHGGMPSPRSGRTPYAREVLA